MSDAIFQGETNVPDETLIVPTSIPLTMEQPEKRKLSLEEKLSFLEDLRKFGDWWKLPLPDWCYTMSPMDNPISVQFFMRDAERYSRIKNGDESMDAEKFAEFEASYLSRLDEFRMLRRMKSPLTQPQRFSPLACFQQETEEES